MPTYQGDVNVIFTAAPKPQRLIPPDVLLLSLEGQKPIKLYKNIKQVALDYALESPTYKMARDFFAQRNLAGDMPQRLKIAGIQIPVDPVDPPEPVEPDPVEPEPTEPDPVDPENPDPVDPSEPTDPDPVNPDPVDPPDPAPLQSTDTSFLDTDLQAIRLVDDDWFFMLTSTPDDDISAALASWAMASCNDDIRIDYRKLFVGKTTNKAFAGGTRRSFMLYTSAACVEENIDAKLLGQMQPYWPKFTTWMFKRMEGVSVADVTRDEEEELYERGLNIYYKEYKQNYTKPGIAGDGEFFDIVIGIDALTFEGRTRIQNVFMKHSIVPYNNMGFSLIGDAASQTAVWGRSMGIIGEAPDDGLPYRLYIPSLADATAFERAERVMPDIIMQAYIGGAIHKVVFRGVLGYETI